MKLKNHLFLFLFLLSFLSESQEFQGDMNFDLYNSRFWKIDYFKLYPLTDAHPYQYLGITDYKFYLFTVSSAKGESLVNQVLYVDQNDWLNFEKGTVNVGLKISDQDDQNESWQTNRLKVIELINQQDLRKAILYEGGDGIDWDKSLMYWYAFSKNAWYNLTKKCLTVSNLVGERIQQIEYKSKFFSQNRLRSHHRFSSDENETFLYTAYDTQRAYLYTPQQEKFKKSDLHELGFNLKNEGIYFLCNWFGKDKVDIMEIVDSGFYVYPQLAEYNYGPRIKLYQNPVIIDDNMYGIGYEYDEWTEFAIADFNNDGFKDILLMGYRPAVVINEGNGLAHGQVLGADRFDPGGYSIVDVDDDGDLDILIDSHQGLTLFDNKNGKFTMREQPFGTTYMDFFFLVDLDNDGDKDLLFRESYKSHMKYAEFEKGGFKEPTDWLLGI